MTMLYFAGPLAVLLMVQIGHYFKMPYISQAVAVWVTVDFTVMSALSLTGILQGHWTPILAGLVNFVAMTSAWDSVRFGQEHPHMHRRRYYVWWPLFWASLLAIATAGNIATAWLAIEFSTLASGALIVEMGGRRALEAAWKYIVIASVGLALALIGIIFVYGSLRAHNMGWSTLSFANLARFSPRIPLVIRQFATVLVLSGIGTKVGLVPFHTWLPDAHSEAPSPVSGMLSGMLLGLCLITIVRFIHAVPITGDAFFTGPHLLLIFGTLSVMVGALALLVQRDIKRLLAYSSIEQLGIMAIGFGIGTPLAETAALLQMALHAVIKSTLFYASGHISHLYHTKQLNKITQLAHVNVRLAVIWSVGLLALAGLPPLGLAYSEWMILQALWQSHNIWVLIFLTAALILTFTALLYHLVKVLWSDTDMAGNDSASDDSHTAALDIAEHVELAGGVR